ncbi:hypothetical protein ACQP2F_28080 [Actinoplanes sp. CA-030573]|uniref:hypothetical protein n=1 Tax=Actinoplanes sp. CA-030573 TaxID=3239898 RepID=UPI003D8D0C4C
MNDFENEQHKNVDPPVGDPTSAPSEHDHPEDGDWKAELRAMEILRDTLEPLPPEVQKRAVEWLITGLGLPIGLAPATVPTNGSGPADPSAGTRLETPKAFMSWKKPTNAAERIACLAYYLTHQRGLPHFKVGDITTLNTEAALAKFGNASRDLHNAETSSGYVVSAGAGGLKQITSRGDALV